MAFPDARGNHMIQFPRAITVLVDKREKRPLLFPDSILWAPYHVWSDTALDFGARRRVKIHPKSVHLESGDYTIAGHEALTIIERKGDITELCDNIGPRDGPRFKTAFARFADACKYPYLFLEFSPASMWNARYRYPNLDVGWVLDVILASAAQFGVRIIWGSSRSAQPTVRRRLGELAVRLMLQHVAYPDSRSDR